jgi:hypothetical protein
MRAIAASMLSGFVRSAAMKVSRGSEEWGGVRDNPTTRNSGRASSTSFSRFDAAPVAPAITATLPAMRFSSFPRSGRDCPG